VFKSLCQHVRKCAVVDAHEERQQFMRVSVSFSAGCASNASNISLLRKTTIERKIVEQLMNSRSHP
jgi:hypothetical protein